MYEVRPVGEPLPDPGGKGAWLSESYEWAKVVRCVCRPKDHLEAVSALEHGLQPQTLQE